MTRKHILIPTLVFLTCLVFSACENDKVTCSANQEFCSAVNNQDFEATGTPMDNFLVRLEPNEPENNLQNLKDWLECMDCVENAEILCNSCIETDPPISELRVEFILNGQITTKTLDILMDEHLRFHSYH